MQSRRTVSSPSVRSIKPLLRGHPTWLLDPLRTLFRAWTCGGDLQGQLSKCSLPGMQSFFFVFHSDVAFGCSLFWKTCRARQEIPALASLSRPLVCLSSWPSFLVPIAISLALFPSLFPTNFFFLFPKPMERNFARLSHCSGKLLRALSQNFSIPRTWQVTVQPLTFL